MPLVQLEFLPPTFGENYCPTPQQFANDFAAGLHVNAPFTLDSVVVSDTAPSDHTKLWFKTLNGGPYTYPSIPLYKWHQVLGLWVASHELKPGKHTWEIIASEAEAWSLDGGSGADPATTAPTSTTGAFWKVEPLLAGRSPMSPGTIPQSNPSKVLGYREAFGEGSHEQTAEELAAHTHPVAAATSITDGDTVKVVNSGSGTDTGLMIGLSGTLSDPLRVAANEFTASQQRFNVIHPVFGMACLVRTDRVYYVG